MTAKPKTDLDEEIRWASAVELMGLIAERRVSAQELQDFAISRIEAFDPHLNSVVIPLFDQSARGVPTLVKDAGQELAGAPHWIGVASLRDAGARSTTTTPLVAVIERAGFSIVGKTSCPVLSNGATTEPAGFAPTRNPWCTDLSVGGSSGGSAAAVAAGLVPFAHGSDAVGSLRIPAALCGVVTLVPTTGMIPVTPPAGAREYLWREFFLARHVEDLEMLFELLGGVVPSYTAPGPLRVGLLTHDPAGDLEIDDGCVQASNRVALALAEFGHIVEQAWPRSLASLPEASEGYLQVLSDAVRPPVLRWLATRLRRPVDVHDVGQAHLDAAARAAARPHDAIEQAEQGMGALLCEVEKWWEDFDLLVTPATFQPAWPIGTVPTLNHIGTLLAPFSFSGQPSVCVPVFGFADGLPRGVQIVGGRGTDSVLLEIAQAMEHVFRWPDERPPSSTSSSKPIDGSNLVQSPIANQRG